MSKLSLKKNNQKGFTLVEMLVAIALFSITMVMALTAILTIVDVNRKSRNQAIIMNDLNFALESIVRSVKSGLVVTRQGEWDELEVVFPNNDVSNNPASPDCFKLTYKFDRTDEENYKLLRYKENISGGSIGAGLPLFSDDVSLENVEFIVDDGDSSGQRQPQPMVTILVSGIAGAGDENTQAEFQLQTSVSQRRLGRFYDGSASQCK